LGAATTAPDTAINPVRPINRCRRSIRC
jgi:hypothetical protein